jgi:hypothetical protein
MGVTYVGVKYAGTSVVLVDFMDCSLYTEIITNFMRYLQEAVQNESIMGGTLHPSCIHMFYIKFRIVCTYLRTVKVKQSRYTP